MDQLQFSKQIESSEYELVLVLRDANGQPTGRKNYSTDSPYKLSQFYLRNQGKPKKKVREQAHKKGVVPSAEQASKILKDVDTYIETTYDEKQQQTN